jgi:Inner membrane protein YgaP-like, transmembrane domain
LSARIRNKSNEVEVVVMIKNMGTLDRGLRAFVVAPAAIVVAFVLGAGTVFGVVLFVVAGIMLTTAVTAFCPTYTVLGISTYPRGLHRVGHGLHAGHA